MEAKTTLRDQLGITQNDLAVLLNVTRSQLSMYELGKRDLPLAAKLQLVDMFVHAQSNTQKTKTTIPVAEQKAQQEQKKKIVNEALLMNQWAQMNLDKKIKSYNKKQQTNVAVAHLVVFLNSNTAKKEEENQLTSLFKKAIPPLEKDNWQALFKLQLKKELLDAEKTQLENFLKKL